MESVFRFAVFLAVLVIMLLWEKQHRFRPLHQSPAKRLATHMGLMLVNFGLLRLGAGGGALAAAVLATENQWGLFAFIRLPQPLGVVAGMIVLDVAIYFQHRVFHRVPLFWRLHRVHHSDVDIDTGTAVRFHALEILLSMYFKMFLVLAFGIDALTVLLFEIVLNACALFNHGNVRLSAGVERYLRWILITPDVHRIHHSIDPRETDSNFGFSVPWWDRLFGTWVAEPEVGQESLQTGLPDLPGAARLGVWRLICLPFR